MPAHLFPISRRQFLAGSAGSIAALGQAQLFGDDTRLDRLIVRVVDVGQDEFLEVHG